MNILFLSHTLQPTGAPRVLLNLVEWLARNSPHRVETFSVEGGALESEFARCGRVHVLHPDQAQPAWSQPFRWVHGLWRAWHARLVLNRLRLRVRSAVGGPQFDIIYANTITLGNFLELLRPGATPVITHVHELERVIDEHGAWNLALVKKYTQHYVAASRAVKEHLSGARGIPVTSISVVHEFIHFPEITESTDALRTRLDLPAGAFIVVGSGTGTRRKGIDLFVDLAARTRAGQGASGLLFLWLGGWDSAENEAEITRRVEAEGLAEVVRFTGHLEKPQEVFAAADVFVLTSREDPYPLVCLEAASVGLPVLCFEEAGGMPEFVEEDAGCVVPHLDVEAMAQKLLELERQTGLRVELGRRAAEKVRQRHGISAAAERVLEQNDSL